MVDAVHGDVNIRKDVPTAAEPVIKQEPQEDALWPADETRRIRTPNGPPPHLSKGTSRPIPQPEGFKLFQGMAAPLNSNASGTLPTTRARPPPGREERPSPPPSELNGAKYDLSLPTDSEVRIKSEFGLVNEMGTPTQIASTALPGTIQSSRERTTSPSPAHLFPAVGVNSNRLDNAEAFVAERVLRRAASHEWQRRSPPPRRAGSPVRSNCESLSFGGPLPPPPLPVVDVAYEVHSAVLKQLQMEYAEGQTELYKLEAQYAEVAEISDRLARDVDELSQILASKKASLERTLKDRHGLEGLLIFMRRKQMQKKEEWSIGLRKAEEMRKRYPAEFLTTGPSRSRAVTVPPATLPRTMSGPLEPVHDSAETVFASSVRGDSNSRPCAGSSKPDDRQEEPFTMRQHHAAGTVSVGTFKRSRSTDGEGGGVPLGGRPDSIESIGGDPPAGAILHFRQVSGNGEICFKYNQAECPEGQNCSRRHVCVACMGSHPFYVCAAKRTSCFRFNNEECGPHCHREHRCLRCASGQHRLPECHIPPAPENGIEYCLTWNSSQNCHSGPNCERRHQCLRCRGSHAVIICPENVLNYFQTVDGRVTTTLPVARQMMPCLGREEHGSKRSRLE
ncbi:uncharacterized protein SPPG_04608 [Spizellomyces punctatus DAOM BR117]|uniref:C3H1-type domain-containing protein n=1 Tax=Spizellomyces punctatus (strain DAOM BR117) TaxID=645134 RepID=A0A0L0HHI5_SPIPD|nr:uncharacterized protein SPPG_04608 [Spizellomyces punctatus DAOM BR117]KND00279.1 hypothetical protein SPPG_04608 [Spizellomyces punctatus DAOM BR117]|eukprot:XP_016608318.1 hypothetical protein SPPG_04608 [Spizellomyces punctatus DAOM BR117]